MMRAQCISTACDGHSGNTYMQYHRCIMPIGMAMPFAGHDAVAFQRKTMTKFDQKTVDVVVTTSMSVFSTYFITCTFRVVEDMHEGSHARLTRPSRHLTVASSHADVEHVFTLGKPYFLPVPINSEY